MNFSRPFIERPIGTTLLAIGLLLLGIVAYRFLPVASLPSVDFPTIRVNASLPGADPETMAARVAAPLERRLGEIAGVNEITSVSSLGSTRITVQFALSRNIEGAAQDVQAALNAAAADLPADMPSLPSFRKSNPAAAPILILALTSETLPPSGLYDAADTVIAQRISQVEGVAEVQVAGAEQPAIRVRVNPTQLGSMGLSIEDVRTAIANANALAPLGIIDGDQRAVALETNAQLRTLEDYKNIIVKVANGTAVRLSDVASVDGGTRNARSAAMFNNKPAILLTIIKSADANVIETVDRIRELIPEIKRWIPPAIEISVLSDRTSTLRASVHDMQLTLALSIVLVMVVVYIFLRRPTPTIAAGITVPLSLAGTCAAMWCLGFSINNLTLMALAVSVGFVVDDAIVMIENMFRNLEAGSSPMRAALDGARQIGFTVVSITISLVAAFIPLLLMEGVVGRLLREFSVTLVVAICVSLVVSLTVTPMICAHFVREAPSSQRNTPRPHRRGRARLDAARLHAHAGGLPRPPRADDVHHACHRRRHGEPLHQDAQGLLPARRHRPDLRRHPGFGRHLLRGDGQAAAPGAGDRAGRPGRRQRRLVGRCRGLQRLGQPRPHVHHPEAAVGARRAHDRTRHRPPAPLAAAGRRAQRLPGRGPGHPGRRAPERFRLPVHAVEPGDRGPLRLGAQGAGAHAPDPRHRRRLERPRAGRPAGQHHRSTGSPPRASACASRTSTTPSTTPSPSARCR